MHSAACNEAGVLRIWGRKAVRDTRGFDWCINSLLYYTQIICSGNMELLEVVHMHWPSAAPGAFGSRFWGSWGELGGGGWSTILLMLTAAHLLDIVRAFFYLAKPKAITSSSFKIHLINTITSS